MKLKELYKPDWPIAYLNANLLIETQDIDQAEKHFFQLKPIPSYYVFLEYHREWNMFSLRVFVETV